MRVPHQCGTAFSGQGWRCGLPPGIVGHRDLHPPRGTTPRSGLLRRFGRVSLGLGRTLGLGLRIADGLCQHLAQLSLSLRRFALGWLPLGHGQYVGTRQYDLKAHCCCPVCTSPQKQTPVFGSTSEKHQIRFSDPSSRSEPMSLVNIELHDAIGTHLQ